MSRLNNVFGRLRWKLTLSYTLVTVGSLLVLGLVLAALLFTRTLVPSSFFTPDLWIEAAQRSAVPILRNVLSQSPVDTELLYHWLEELDTSLTHLDLFRIRGATFGVQTDMNMNVLVVGPDGVLLAVLRPGPYGLWDIGGPVDHEMVPGLRAPLEAALAGQEDPARLVTSVGSRNGVIVAVPIKSDGHVLGVLVALVDYLPTLRDAPALTAGLLARGSLLLLLAAGVVGAVFGSITAGGMSARIRRLAIMADAWSVGDFAEHAEDTSADEIGQLSRRLNGMAEQLESLMRKRQEIAVSDERNRLARDLHDSAKQEALAASFQLGTAITLFERDPPAARSHLEEANRLMDAVRAELTGLIHELRPQAMDGRDFAEALNEYAVEWAHQNGVEIRVNVEGNDGLSLKMKQGLFRIMQEALANVVRHSSAGRVDISLRYSSGSVILSISDDGSGFRADMVHGGMGLHSMRERAEFLNGSFQVQSVPGRGTRVSVALPVASGEQGGSRA